MRERPILFNGPMVRAILDGRKTQTRRIAAIKSLQITAHTNEMVSWAVHFSKPHNRTLASHGGGRFSTEGVQRSIAARYCPNGKPGDRLWVRESYRFTNVFDGDSASCVAERCLDAGYSKPWAPIQYEADDAQLDWKHVGTPPYKQEPVAGNLRPNIFMPRWASRITLEITGVRVERLQDISRGDAMAEGCPFPNMAKGDDPRQWYAGLWNQINGPSSWDANPWVWVVEFQRVQSGGKQS